MVRKNYTDEFRWRAVGLFESTPDVMLKGVAAGLGISRGALREWVDKLGSGTRASAMPRPASSQGRSESQAARIARLEAENAALQVEKTKLETERDILRSAAKYFAGEAKW